MKKTLLISLAALTVGCTAYASNVGSSREASADRRTAAEAQLAGRTPEAPRACVRSRDIQGRRTLATGVILFEGRGGRVYVNETRGSCRLTPGTAFKRQTISPNMCAGEIIDTFDPVSGTPLGSCTLGEFMPYARSAR